MNASLSQSYAYTKYYKGSNMLDRFFDPVYIPLAIFYKFIFIKLHTALTEIYL